MNISSNNRIIGIRPKKFESTIPENMLAGLDPSIVEILKSQNISNQKHEYILENMYILQEQLDSVIKYVDDLNDVMQKQDRACFECKSIINKDTDDKFTAICKVTFFIGTICGILSLILVLLNIIGVI